MKIWVVPQFEFGGLQGIAYIGIRWWKRDKSYKTGTG